MNEIFNFASELGHGVITEECSVRMTNLQNFAIQIQRRNASHTCYFVQCSRIGKPDNLYICTDNLTTKKYCRPTRTAKLSMLETCTFLYIFFYLIRLRHINAQPGTVYQFSGSVILKNIFTQNRTVYVTVCVSICQCVAIVRS